MSWSLDQSFTPSDKELAECRKKFRLVSQEETGDSITRALAGLQNGQIQIPEGICIAFSENQQKHYILFRSGKWNEAEEAVSTAANEDVPATSLIKEVPLIASVDLVKGRWHVNQALALEKDGELEACKKILEVLSKDQAGDSITKAVEALETGQMEMPGGMCIAFSAQAQGHFLLFRPDKEHEVIDILSNATPTTSAIKETPLVASVDLVKGSWDASQALGLENDGKDASLVASVDLVNGRWGANRALELEEDGELEASKSFLTVLSKEETGDSITKAVEALETGEIEMPAGMCIAFSARVQKHYVLFRSDMEEDVKKALSEAVQTNTIKETALGASVGLEGKVEPQSINPAGYRFEA